MKFSPPILSAILNIEALYLHSAFHWCLRWGQLVVWVSRLTLSGLWMCMPYLGLQINVDTFYSVLLGSYLPSFKPHEVEWLEGRPKWKYTNNVLVFDVSVCCLTCVMFVIFWCSTAPALPTTPNCWLHRALQWECRLCMLYTMWLLSVLVAEIMHHKFPHLVQKHNYSTANSTSKKMDNWYYLNR